MKRNACAMLVVLLCLAPAAIAAEPLVLPVWPDRQPPADAGAEKVVERGKDKPNRAISNVKWPTMTVYLPAADQNTGAAVVICPGGGYGGLAIDKEGHDVARWLNSIGVAGVVLKYRMPKPELTGHEKPWPLQDAQQAIRLVRGRAAEWKLKANRIGIMGFSAGGHLASTAGTHFDAGQPDARDPIARESCRPDFMILAYPVVTFKDPLAHKGSRTNLIGKAPDEKLIEEYSNELHVTAQTPPTFLVHAKDDGVKVENSIQFAAALKKAGVPHQLLLLEKGGHGFGLGVNGGEPATWPQRCAEWLKAQKLLDKP